MIAPEELNSGLAVARMENVELTYVGQSFRLGRYPIHFHIIGDGSASYVRKCSVHQTFNRGLNIHNTNNLTVSDNVFFNSKGGTIFLEDGIEMFNSFIGNLVAKVLHYLYHKLRDIRTMIS